MAERKKYFLRCVCFPMLFLFGCSTSFNKQAHNEHRVKSGLLEKRIDDLSGKINLVVTDANVLHNEIEATKTSNAIIQKKIDGLEATTRDLNERITRLNTPINRPNAAPLLTEPPMISNVPVADSKPTTTPTPHVVDAGHTEDLLAAARGFWDAMNASDIQAAGLYITKESRDTLQKKDTDATVNRKVTFGEVRTEGNKTSIETTIQPYPEATEPDIRMQTVLVKEDGQWKVDAGQTMASMPGGAMGATQAEIMPKQESTAVTTESDKQSAVVGLQKDTGETKQTGVAHQDTMQQKQETAVIDEAGSPAQREKFLKENIARLAEAEFPDQKGLQWNILSFEHKAHLTYAEAEPAPATFGYPRIKFAVSFKNPEIPRVIGTYGFKDGQYSLLSTKKN